MAASSWAKNVLALILVHVTFTAAELPEKILCADSRCIAPISRVQTLFSYDAPDPHHLSFSQHDVIQVFAKDLDESGIWTGELLMKPGTIGLFKKELVKELVTFNKRPSQHVSTVDFFAARAARMDRSKWMSDVFQKKDTAAEKGPKQSDTKEGNGTDQGQDIPGPDSQDKNAEVDNPQEVEEEVKKSLGEETEVGDITEDVTIEDVPDQHMNAEGADEKVDIDRNAQENLETSDKDLDSGNDAQSSEDDQGEDTSDDKVLEGTDGADEAEQVDTKPDGTQSQDRKVDNSDTTQLKEETANTEDLSGDLGENGREEEVPVEAKEHEDQINASPSVEVIDGTTIYLSDLEPTPVPEQPKRMFADGSNTIFTMSANDVVDVPKEEEPAEEDDGPAPPPTTYTVKSEEEIDPEAYKRILHRLHANPELQHRENAIQQEMLKILRNPELKKNLLFKPPPKPATNILSQFMSPPPPGEDVPEQDQLRDQTGEPSASHDTVETTRAVQLEEPNGPDNEDVIPDPSDTNNLVDPLAILKEEGLIPNSFLENPGSMPEHHHANNGTKDLLQAASEPVHGPAETQQMEDNDADDPTALTASLDSQRGQNTDAVESVGPAQTQDDMASEGLANADKNHTVQAPPNLSVSPEALLQNSVPSSPEPLHSDGMGHVVDQHASEARRGVPPATLEETPTPIIDPSPSPDTNHYQDVHREIGHNYGEPGIRSSTRFPLQVQDDVMDNEPHHHHVNGESDAPLDVDPSRGEQAEEVDSSEEDGSDHHHQMYTKEQNPEEWLDDGVNVEVEVEEELEKEREEEAEFEKIHSDNWLSKLVNNTQPAFDVLTNSFLVPLLHMMPPQFQHAVQQSDFLGVPWVAVIILEVSIVGFIACLLCCWVCGSRRNRSVQESLKREVEVLTAQKAEVMDTLDMTNAQFQKQNLEFYELKSATDRTGQDKSKLEKTCKELNQAVKEQKHEVERMKSSLKKKTAENETSHQKVRSLENQVRTSQSAISDLNAKVQNIEGRIHVSAEECSHLKQEVASLEEQNEQLLVAKELLEEETKGQTERVSELTEQQQLLNSEKKDLEDSLTNKNKEIEVLKDCLLQLKGLQHIEDEGPEVDSEAKIHHLLDVTRINAKLSLIQKERDELEEKLEREVKAERGLETQVGSLNREVDGLRVELARAKSDYIETQTKMEVLQEYFKNKEVDLQRKLGREEALKLQSEEQLTNLSDKAISAEVDLDNYRQQIADLKAELEKSERTYRTQVNAHEKKAHEHWLSSRSAERELQEAKREAASLRHRLTELEGRRATSENPPLVKPHAAAPSPMRVVSPSFRPGDRGNRSSRRGPSRNSIIETDSPSPPLIDPRLRDSPPMMDRDMLPPPMRHDMGPSPFGREPIPPHHPDFLPPGPGPYGHPPPLGPPLGDFPPDFPPHPDDIDYGLHGPPPPDFVPPPRFPPPGRGEFDPHGPPPMMDHGYGPRFGPPPIHGMEPRGPQVHGPGPFPGDGPPPTQFDRRGPPPGMRPGSRQGQLGPPDAAVGGPRTSSPMVPDSAQTMSPRGPLPRQPPNMQT